MYALKIKLCDIIVVVLELMLMQLIDKRLEFLEALVIASKQINDTVHNEELDFVKYYDIPYVKELVNSIKIQKYPEVVDYINDINDCGYYTNLFLYLNENFEIIENPNFQIFEHKSVSEFVKTIKNIYESENIEGVFGKYENFLNNLSNNFNYKYNIDFTENLRGMYGPVNDMHFATNISLLINGGFSSKKDNAVSYVRGIKVNSNNIEDIVFSEYTIVCLYHEYSHYFVNQIIDKYFEEISNLDILYNESLINGLPKTYQNKKTLLYEYFVRANSLILSENQISANEYAENINWYKELGFIRIEEMIEIIKKGLKEGLYFNNIFEYYVIPYFEDFVLTYKK